MSENTQNEHKESIVTKSGGGFISFVQKNQKNLTYLGGAIVIGIVGFFAFRQFYIAPQEQEAQEALSVVQKQFELDSFALVVNGNGTDLSGPEIADDYSLTKAGNLAAFYSGISYLRTGKYEEAISYLKKFDSDDKLVGPIALGAIGSAEIELGNVEEGASYYMKAARHNKNEFTTPYFLKEAGLAYEKLENPEKALECYETIRKDFRESPEFAEIEKYIARAKAKAGKLD